MVKKKTNAIAILLLILFSLLFLNFYLFLLYLEKMKTIDIPSFGEIEKIEEKKSPTLIKIEYSCIKDEDCILTSTNCCPEFAGAYWECISRNSSIICNLESVLCPQVFSPKPKIVCKCVNSFCIPS